MKKLILLPLLLLLLPLGNSLRAQAYIGLHGGVTLPTGFYADSKLCDLEWMFLNPGHQKRFGAGTGFFGGIDIAYAMPFHHNLSVVVTADYMQSGFNKDVQEYLDNRTAEGIAEHDSYETTLPQLRNIPIMAGVRYSYPIGVYYDLYGEALAGVNIRNTTPRREYWKEENKSKEDVWNFDSDKTFAFRLGAGVIIRDIVTLGASYTMLGLSQLKYDHKSTFTFPTATGTESHPESVRFDDPHYTFNPSMVMITLGIRFTPFRNMTRNVQDI